MLDQFVLVLHQPQDVVNIAAVVRAMKNMGLRHLRLVAPAPFDPADVRGIAHRSDDILAALQIYSTLDAALADAVYVVGTSEHRHSKHPVRSDLRSLASELLQYAAAGPVALLFGPEDNGLDHAALDRCHIVLSLPSDPAYPSLNLAQAALLLMYELRVAALAAPPLPAVRQPAPAANLETFFGAAEGALQAIEFFKSGSREPVMRVLRQLIYRATPDPSEIALLTAMARELRHFLRRKGLDSDT